MSGIAEYLYVEHEQRHTGLLEFLGQTGVIDVVVGRQAVADLVERHVHAPQICAHETHAPRPAEIHKQARRARTDNPEVCRAIADVDDGQLWSFRVQPTLLRQSGIQSTKSLRAGGLLIQEVSG